MIISVKPADCSVPAIAGHPFSVAPMMDRTDRHFRYFMRQISRHALLYTEMVTTQAIHYGDRDHLLGFSPTEKPLALQLGGDDPKALAVCARIAADYGYDEINLNVGCPSDRVQSGHFGACLMAQPDLVAEGVAAMMAATPLPVSVKHRIGIDDQDSYEHMAQFVQTVAATGCRRFTVHARKAWLQGLSPKENRTVPPLRHKDIYRLKGEFPHLWIEINGGIKTIADVQTHLQQVDAVMVGRAAYDTPYEFATVDQAIFGDETPPLSRHQVVEVMMPYLADWTAGGLKANKITRHMLMLFHGQPGSRLWKQQITEKSVRPGAGVEILEQALSGVTEAQRRSLATPH